MITRQKIISAAIITGTLLGILYLFVYSRGSRKFEKKMVSAITTNCQDYQKCLLRPRDITNFQWDKMFVFGYDANKSDVERILGTNFNWGGEFQRKVVFIDNKRIVFHEEEPADVEHPLKDEVVFVFPPNLNYGVYSPDAVFKVSEKWSTDGRYFELNEVR